MSQVSAAHFVFVHGASHGAWCWYKIRALLEKVGHTVTCIDLASAGINTSDPRNIVDFEEYNQPFSDFMAEVPKNEKVILVGHSLGGLSVTHGIHKFGEKIQLAVYLAAAMLKTNTGGVPATVPAEDVEYDWSGNTPTVIVKQEALHKLFYNRSPSEVILVGHSLGGLSVTHAIHKFGEKIELAVYLAALMLKTNTGGAPSTIPAEDVEYDLSGNTPTAIIKQEALHKLLYNRSPSEDLALASMLLRPCPLVSPIAEDGGDPYVDRVRRVFVKTMADNLMNSSAHEEMIKGWPPAQTFEVDSDHSAFFSAPTQLVSILVEATRNAKSPTSDIDPISKL